MSDHFGQLITHFNLLHEQYERELSCIYVAYDYEVEGDGSDGSGGSYGESDDEYGDSNINDAFESKFGPLKRFALNVHTGKYDNEIEVEMSNIVANVGNVREIDPADLEERRAFAVENLKLQLKGLAHEADTGVLSRITLLSSTITPDVEEPVLSHDPSTEMYWKESFTALENADKAIKIQNISITKIEMIKDVVDQFIRLLHGRVSNLRRITFNHTNLCREGLLSLSTLVEQCPALHTLDISYNTIDDINVATCISRALRSHPVFLIFI
jgi:Leucine-rich repeat (LRR) protein